VRFGDLRQVEDKYRQPASTWGFTEPYNRANGVEWMNALRDFVGDSATERIPGTFRGRQPVIHWLNPTTRMYVQTDTDGNFVTAYRLNEDQAQNVIERGGL
jgi:hypothetical protein